MFVSPSLTALLSARFARRETRAPRVECPVCGPQIGRPWIRQGRWEARRRYGIALWESLPATSPRDRDVIVLLHSLEHMQQPALVLRSLLGWLAPGGALFIEVPNAQSFEMLRAKRRKMILDLPL